MGTFLTFFETMPTWQKLAWVMGCLSFCWLLEGNYKLVTHKYRKWKHAGINFAFLGFTFVINFLFGLATIGVFAWLHTNEFGLLHLVDFPIWVELFISLLIFDLIAQYGVHYFLHKIKFMWRFHMIHHSDTKVDVTSGTRHHPGDYIFRELAALLAAIIIGAPLAFYLFYRIVTVFFTYTTHANVRLPAWVDKTFGLVFITPNMHKFHHHFERPWTDTNFGNIFSIWDRLFGTLVVDDPKKVKYGLDVLDNSKDENFWYQLKVPFDKSIKTDY
jgi:sterol desaturase/sphingolipid hydroxylase (fatty acid hydroxylase superfamily)